MLCPWTSVSCDCSFLIISLTKLLVTERLHNGRKSDKREPYRPIKDRMSDTEVIREDIKLLHIYIIHAAAFYVKLALVSFAFNTLQVTTED